MVASYALTMPAGYWTAPGRDEFGQLCLTLHSERFGILSDHDCRADAIYAAQAHADELADEASAEAAAAAGGAYEATLDTLYLLVAQRIAKPAADDHEARGEQKAIRAVLAAIEAIGNRPAAQLRSAA